LQYGGARPAKVKPMGANPTKKKPKQICDTGAWAIIGYALFNKRKF
jgi:hypothetical protein